MIPNIHCVILTLPAQVSVRAAAKVLKLSQKLDEMEGGKGLKTDEALNVCCE